MYASGFFFGRYLALGYTVGPKICLPVPLDDPATLAILKEFPCEGEVVQGYPGFCIENAYLAEEIRKEWGMSFSDKRCPENVRDGEPEFIRGLLEGFLSQTDEPLIRGLLSRLSGAEVEIFVRVEGPVEERVQWFERHGFRVRRASDSQIVLLMTSRTLDCLLRCAPDWIMQLLPSTADPEFSHKYIGCRHE